MFVKKFFKKLGWSAIPLIVLGSVLALWILKPLILSQYLTSRLEVRTLVGSIQIGKSETSIGDFKIKNPLGYKTRNAFRAAKATIQYNYKKLFSNPSEIDLIDLEDVFLSIEFDNPLGTKNNWTNILEKIPSHSRMDKELIIHKLVVNDLKIEIRGLGLSGRQTKVVSHIELDEINSQDGFPTKELIIKIFGVAGIEQYIQDLLNPTNTLKKLFNPLGATAPNRAPPPSKNAPTPQPPPPHSPTPANPEPAPLSAPPPPAPSKTPTAPPNRAVNPTTPPNVPPPNTTPGKSAS